MELEKRKELAKYLRWGDKTAIAKLANVERQTVERWIKGDTKTSTVEPYIVEFAKRRRMEVERRMEAVNM